MVCSLRSFVAVGRWAVSFVWFISHPPTVSPLRFVSDHFTRSPSTSFALQSHRLLFLLFRSIVVEGTTSERRKAYGRRKPCCCSSCYGTAAAAALILALHRRSSLALLHAPRLPYVPRPLLFVCLFFFTVGGGGVSGGSGDGSLHASLPSPPRSLVSLALLLLPPLPLVSFFSTSP